MSSFSISIVTPVYNRRIKVLDSINSSLELINSGYAREVIVIDDASTDNTYVNVKSTYSNEISKGILKLYQLSINSGVTGAKNFGASKASGDFVVFMDSDDIFLDGSGELMLSTIANNPTTHLFFFRCLDLSTKMLIGRKQQATDVGLKELLNYGTPGECLPIVSRNIFDKYPYDTDLRGGESLAYYRMLKSGYKAHISDIVVRGYCTNGLDRLSSQAAIRRRAKNLFFYNVRLFSFFAFLSFRSKIKLFVNLLRYKFWSLSVVSKFFLKNN